MPRENLDLLNGGEPSLLISLVKDKGDPALSNFLYKTLSLPPACSGEIPGNGVDDDQNGLIDDVHGYDFGGSCAYDVATQHTNCRCDRGGIQKRHS